MDCWNGTSRFALLVKPPSATFCLHLRYATTEYEDWTLDSTVATALLMMILC